jgi:DNA (cytosine-5)-methyltransferase 1
MRYLSVCSGIEAATVAWHPLGWTACAFSEIEPFPSAVLAHHYPTVPNLGDMTRFKEWHLDQSPDLLVGGTPCQSFSVAGLRKGLDDPRGNLALTFLAIADRYRPRWIVWENVPGVLSSGRGRDFGAFLGALGALGYGWSYRVLDAQYFGLAQRRKRVFVVGYLGDWRRAAAVLFEQPGVRGDPPSRGEAGERVTPILEAGARTGRSTDDIRAGSGIGDPGDPMYTLQSGKQHAVWPAEVAPTLGTTWGDRHPGTQNQDSIAQKGGHFVPSVANPLTARMHKGINTTCDEGQTMIAHTLRADGFDASEDGTGRGTPLAVRRLLPVECEKLQGFSPGHTDIIYRGKPAADGPRYKALGNSMAVPVVRWIGERIAMVETLDLTSGRLSP